MMGQDRSLGRMQNNLILVYEGLIKLIIWSSVNLFQTSSLYNTLPLWLGLRLVVGVLRIITHKQHRVLTHHFDVCTFSSSRNLWSTLTFQFVVSCLCVNCKVNFYFS